MIIFSIWHCYKWMDLFWVFFILFFFLKKKTNCEYGDGFFIEDKGEKSQVFCNNNNDHDDNILMTLSMMKRQFFVR